VDDPIVAIQVDLHLAVGIEVRLPRIALAGLRHSDIVFEAAAAPDGKVHLALVVRDGIIPNLFHGGVLFGEDCPLPRLGVVAAGAGRGRGPHIVVLHAHAVHHAAESGQAAAEQAKPHVAGLRVHVDRGDDLPRQPVLLLPGAELAGPLVVAGQPVLGANPHPRAVGLHGEDVIVRQAVGGGEVPPMGVDVGKLIVCDRLGGG
jgi:hypothetical protein